MPTQKKIDTVTNLTEKLGKAKVAVLTDYRGLKHKQLEELRKVLKKDQGELIVAKNRLIKRALGDKAAGVEASLSESTAILFAYADEVAPLKSLLKFFKTAGLGKTKAGLMGDTVMSEPELVRLASLPTRDVLLASVVRQLNAPIQGLHHALQWNINKLVWALDGVRAKRQ
jgi:large subunit ribosomal protein L10